MKHLSTLLIAAFFATILFTGCEEEIEPEVIELISEFTYRLDGEAPDALLVLNCETKTASYCKWTFSPGADKDSSEYFNTNLRIDKAGIFIVKLEVSDEEQYDMAVDTLIIPGTSALNSIEYNLFHDQWRWFFSMETGKMWGKYGYVLYDNPDISIKRLHLGETQPYRYIRQNSDTKVENHGMDKVSIEVFNNLTSDILANLEIEHDSTYLFGEDDPNIILIENSKGRKGVILCKDDGYIYNRNMHIKYEKYLNDDILFGEK